MYSVATSRACAPLIGLVLLLGSAGIERAIAQTHASVSPPPDSSVQPMQARPDTVDRYGMVFDNWLAKRQPKTAILVVRRGGKTVFARGYGADPYKPTMIASLSKPITGACVATLIRDHKISFTTRMRNALSRFFTRYGKPTDPRPLLPPTK